MNWFEREENWALLFGFAIALAPFMWMVWEVTK